MAASGAEIVLMEGYYIDHGRACCSRSDLSPLRTWQSPRDEDYGTDPVEHIGKFETWTLRSITTVQASPESKTAIATLALSNGRPHRTTYAVSNWRSRSAALTSGKLFQRGSNLYFGGCVHFAFRRSQLTTLGLHKHLQLFI